VPFLWSGNANPIVPRREHQLPLSPEAKLIRDSAMHANCTNFTRTILDGSCFSL
jgi:hypothetical protein